MRFPEFGITDDRRAVIVQDEVRTTSFRELLLAAPEDGVRKHPVEGYPQWPLLGPVRPMQLEARVENHGTVKKINVEERDPAFQTVRHGHPIDPLEVHVVKTQKKAHHLRLKGGRVARRIKVPIACKRLIRAFSAQHDLDVLGGKPGHEVARHRALDQRCIVGLQMRNDRLQRRGGFRLRVDVLMVMRPEVLGDLSCCRKIGGAFDAHGKAVQLVDMRAHDRRDQARVEPAGQKDAEGDIAHQPLLNRAPQRAGQHVLIERRHAVERAGSTAHRTIGAVRPLT